MKSVNLYTLSRNISFELLPDYIEALSNRIDFSKVKREEIDTIRMLVSELLANNISKQALNEWFYSFTIPRISKEFDLLKIGDANIVNIELKSQLVSDDRILKQLEQNAHYLKHINSDIRSYTFVKMEDSDYRIYRYAGGDLTISNIQDLVFSMNECINGLESEIEKKFKPRDYLISPFNTPEKFVEGMYYLNTQQDNVKKEIISSSDNKVVWGISGEAGTGKSLLIYDIAKEYAKSYSVGIIHCGIKNDGHEYIERRIPNISIYAAKEIRHEILTCHEILIIDEAQRLHPSDYDVIMNALSENVIKRCIWAYDYKQVLSKKETKNDIPSKLSMIEGITVKTLKNNIRINPELFSFIRNMIRLYDVPEKTVDYAGIDILYADSYEEFCYIKNLYEERDYKYIAYTPSRNNRMGLMFDEYENSHRYVGQEFDNVMVMMDSSFSYFIGNFSWRRNLEQKSPGKTGRRKLKLC